MNIGINLDLIKRLKKADGYLLLCLVAMISKYYLFLVYSTNLQIGVPKLINIFINMIYLIGLGLIFINLRLDFKDKILFLIGIIITLLSKNENMLIFFMLGIYSKNNNISIKRIIIYYAVINLVFFVFIFLLNYLGILSDGVNTHYRNEIERQDFGFGNPNVPYLCLVPILSAYIYLNIDKYSFKNKAIIVAIITFIYFTTYSRTGMLTMVIALILIELLRKVDFDIVNKNTTLKVIFSSIFLLIGILSIVIAVLNGDKLNLFLSSRPRYWNYYISHVSLLGLNSSTELMYPLDNSYIYLLSMFGVVASIFICYIIIKGTYLIIRKKDIGVFCLINIFFVYSFGENIFFNKALNPVMIILITYFLDDFAVIVNNISKKIKMINKRRL